MLQGFDNVELCGFEPAVAKSDIVVLLVDHKEFRNANRVLLHEKCDHRHPWRLALTVEGRSAPNPLLPT